MKTRHSMIIGVIVLGLCAAWAAAKQNPTPPPVILKNDQGEQVQLYAKSYALLIGVSNYRIWPDLPGVNDDIPAVEAVLKQHGFEVIPVMNPKNYAELDRAFRNFINTSGSDTENRLLFYFAGHGKTLPRQDGKDMGYLVAADAPFAEKDRNGFLDNALDMATVAGYAKNIQAKHALFLFDSCFSGSIFENTRGEPEELAYYKASKPVRQFITPGSKDERVPDRSVFREEFVAALEGEGDVNGDGYVTGGELGNFLDNRVVLRRKDEQHPQYGKMSDYDKGDVVFALPKAATPAPASTPPSVTTRQGFSDLDALAAMEEAFAVAQEQEGRKISAATKREYWRRFMQDFPADIPGFDNDEEMRQYAAQRIAALQQPTPRPSEERKPTPTPTAKPISTPLSVTSCWENETPGATCTEETTGMEFVYVPGDCFMMGSPEDEEDRGSDETQHRVCVKGFWMGKYEVTNAQYRRFKADHDSKDYDGKSLNGDTQPAVYVNWDEATKFTGWLTKQGQGTFRLPSEAEWEYAARAGTTTARYWSDDPNDACTYANVHDQTSKKAFNWNWQEHTCNDGYAVTAPVGQFDPNAFGLYDMLGNVWEWCQDWYAGYDKTPTDGSAYLSGGSNRVLRGGSWVNAPGYARSADRDDTDHAYRDGDIGFRVVREK